MARGTRMPGRKLSGLVGFGRLVEAVLAVAIASGLVGWLGSVAIRYGWFSGVDDLNLRGVKAAAFFTIITWFGTAEGVIVTSLIMLVVLLALRLYQPALVFVTDLLTSAIANDQLKSWVARERPAGVDMSELGFAFPSGHAFVCTAVFGLFAWILARYIREPFFRFLIAGGFTLFILLIAYSRLYLGVHYLSDVLAGLALGLCWLVMFARAAKLPERRGTPVRARPAGQ
ncbi:MAG: phosphatase PAP2 family protein [Limnochordales bacterium]|nr:phosphatase PAP2 family protein [Limnochordales bacterium]